MNGWWITAIGAAAAAAGAWASFAASRARIRETRGLFDAGMRLNSTLKRQEQMALILEKVQAALPVEEAAVLLWDRDAGELVCEAGTGGRDEATRDIRLARGEGIAGTVAATGVSEIVNDPAGDPRRSGREAAIVGAGPRNLLAVAIRDQGEADGVLLVANKKRGKRFAARDRRLLEQIARPVAVALENARLYEKLEQSMSQLQMTNAIKERLESELQIAGGIQMSFLPRTMPSAHEPYDVCALLKSAKEVGGDFYNFFKIDNSHLFFTLGDVSDKGIPAALFMAVTLTLLKGKIGPGVTPGQLLEMVNEELLKDNPLLFATIVCGIFDCDTGEVVMSEGGHCTPYIVRGDGEVQPYKLKKSLPLAAMEGVSYHDSALVLQPGDRLVLYTDGITEAENRRQEHYGGMRLQQFLGMTPGMSSAEVIDALLMNVFLFADGAPQSDDIAVLSLMRR